MKQPKRNFVIEYKSGRRRSATTQTSSIWGNIDLKSVAQAVETDMPKPVIGIDAAIDTPSEHSAQDIVAETNAAARVTAPPDGEDVVASVDPATYVDHEAPVGDEKAIGAQELGSSAEGDTPETTASSEPSGAGHASRRVRTTNVRGDRQPVKPTLAKPKLASRSGADKELADLFQLEEENRQLRRLLVVKLREENGWLRERLQRG